MPRHASKPPIAPADASLDDLLSAIELVVEGMRSEPNVQAFDAPAMTVLATELAQVSRLDRYWATAPKRTE